MKTQKALLLTVGLTIASFSFSCGIKGPPLPPLKPDTVQKQKAQEAAASQNTAPANKTTETETTNKKKTQ